MRAINPATGNLIREYPEHDPNEVEARVAAAHGRAAAWRQAPLAQRGALLDDVAQRLLARRGPLADRIVAQMGKPVGQARAEVEKCAAVCRFFAGHGARFLAPEPVDVGDATAYVAYQPLGVVLAILPWNFPLWQAFRFLAPALMAGNTVLIKPAPSTVGSGLDVEDVLREVGAPPGLVSVLAVEESAVEGVIRDPRVAAVTLTGSDRAGRAVAAVAGSALKKVVLELGGSDPYVVLADADVDVAVAATVRSRLNNGGQSCIGAKRVIVDARVHSDFCAALRAQLAVIQPSDPRDPACRLGPLARADLRDTLHDQVQRTVEAGAKLELGGVVPPGPGFWYPLTLLSSVAPHSPAFREELFGPVFAVAEARDEAHALALANDSPYGLGAAVFTRDLQRGLRIAEHDLEAGSCFVNESVRSDPRLPFGGVKHSGFGRELSRHGILELCNVKTIWAAAPRDEDAPTHM